MNETPTKTWLKEIVKLLEELQPVLQQNIRTLEHDLKPEGSLLKNLLQTEIKKQEALVERIKEAKERGKYLLYDPDPKTSDESDGIHSDTEFIVTMPNGKKIGCKDASETYSKTLIGLGITRVMEQVKDKNLYHLGIPLVDTDKHSLYERKRDGKRRGNNLGCFPHEYEGITYYIMTNMDNDDKEKFLTDIAKLLNVSLKIDRPEKESISSLI